MLAGQGDGFPGAAAGRGGFRASHADRDRVIYLLRAAFAHGRLTKNEFDERLAHALAARTYAELAALTTDLHPGLAGAQVSANPRHRAGRWDGVPRRWLPCRPPSPR